MLPLAPKIQSRINPDDYYMLQINQDTDYLGEYNTNESTKRIPEWKLSILPKDPLTE